MNVIAYTRISTDGQDLEKQKHLLLDFAQKQGWLIAEFIEVAVSSKKSRGKRKIDELSEKLKKGDVLLVAELSRLGRNSGIYVLRSQIGDFYQSQKFIIAH